ncbi:MAG: hypothetical protein WAX69_01540 [Victivallales bacterium]
MRKLAALMFIAWGLALFNVQAADAPAAPPASPSEIGNVSGLAAPVHTAPGEHPRIIFTRAELPELRARIELPQVQPLYLWLREMTFGRDDKLIDALIRRDEATLATLRSDSRAAERDLNAAMIYVLSNRQQDGLAAAEMFRLWLATFPADEQLDGLSVSDPRVGWGDWSHALAYDCIHDQLSNAERQRTERILALMVKLNADIVSSSWWLDGRGPNGRLTNNWTPIWAAHVGLCNLVLEGSPAYRPDIQRRCIQFMREFLNEGIAPDGGMYEGLHYANFGLRNMSIYYLMALRLRNVDLITTTHLKQVPFWFTYEMLPWGGEAQGMNASSGMSSFSEQVCLPNVLFHAQEFPGTLSDWIFVHASGWRPGPVYTDPLLFMLNGVPSALAATGPLSNAPSRPKNPSPVNVAVGVTGPGMLVSGQRPDSLPLGHWFSTIGKVISRGGWGPQDAHFVINTNPLYAGHSHGDHGSFCLASHGVNFIVDSDFPARPSTEHNLVHIDGVGQNPTDGVAESFIRTADFSAYADTVDIDLELAYDRVLNGGWNGPWHWENNNPVERADRRALFIRGITGPIVVMADTLRKDGKTHNYDWLARTGVNNLLTVEGRQFAIGERYGGKYLSSLGSGQECTWIARDIPEGKYRGWLLVRGVPYPPRWSNTTVKINGRAAPYDTTYFQTGNFQFGWHWEPILLNGLKGDSVMTLPAGELRLDLVSQTGVQVALAVFTCDLAWQPGFTIPQRSGTCVVLDAESVQQGKVPWSAGTDPRAILTGIFLGKTPPALSTTKSKQTQYPVLNARLSAIDGRFLCVMTPWEESAPRRIELPQGEDASAVIVHASQGVDIVGGSLDGAMTMGSLVTDAVAAAISLTDPAAPATIRSYAVMQGSTLRHRQMTLVEAAQPVTVLNDGRQLVVRGPDGIGIECVKLTATALIVNGKSVTLPQSVKGIVRVAIPSLPTTWQVQKKENGRVIEVTGNGPLPLMVPAPDALDVRVNGVSRYFVRDKQGNIWPLLERGTECFQYANELNADQLLSKAAPGCKAKMDTLPQSRDRALVFPEGKAVLNLNTAGPGRYMLNLSLHVKEQKEITVSIGGQPVSVPIPQAGGSRDITSIQLPETIIRDESVCVTLDGTGPLAIAALRLTPVFQRITGDQWQTIGPFPSPWATSMSTNDVKKAMETAFPPEKEMRLDAAYPGAGDTTVAWRHTADARAPGMNEGVNFTVTNGVRSRDICYAVTFITSPDNRRVRLLLGCDYWANVYLNGELVPSERNSALVANDGAHFSGFENIGADLHLNKGMNVLLVKCQGGSAGVRIMASITNPGDLILAPQP